MKILLLNQTFYPDVASTAQHLADLAAELAGRGHQVTVITSRRAYDDPETVFASQETWRGVRILRLGSPGFGKRSNWSRVLEGAIFMVLCCLRGLFLPRQNVVLALTSPPLISLVAVCLARCWRCRFVYWVMDLYPDVAVAAGCLRAGALSTRILEHISCFALRQAHQLIVLDHFMRARIVQKGVPAEHISILPPWSHDPLVRFDETGRDRFRKKHRLDGKFVVMYSGNHSPCHPLDTVIEVARRLASRQDVVFCFVGGGTEFRRIQKACEQACPNSALGRSGLPNVMWLLYQPLDQLSASLSAADLHLVILGNAFVGLVHPCKIYNLLRVRSPLIYLGPELSSISEILADLNGCLSSASLRHGDVNGLLAQIEAFRSHSAQSTRATLDALCSPFSLQTILPKLVAHLEESSFSTAAYISKYQSEH